jgi:exosome complex component RRP43
MSTAHAHDSNELQAVAFKRLYPDQYYARFIDNKLRPDGRPLSGARATTIGLHPVECAHSSALVKVGNTTAIAGVKLQVCFLGLIRLRIAAGS